MKDQIKKVRGFVKILHFDKDMSLINTIDVENLVVTAGLNWVAGRLNDPPPAFMNYIAVGTDATVPTLSETILVAEIYRAPVSILGGSVSGNSIIYTQTIPPGAATGALQEAGIFNNGVAGTMLSRVTYPVVNKGPSDTIAISWTITIG